jgi:uncharacterized protein YyaL (SSP411 family)
MDAVQALAGRGGWPMTVFLTPDGRPFFGGTYFPKEPRAGMPSFVQLCQAVAHTWSEKRSDVDQQAERLTAALGQATALAVPDGGADLPTLDAAEAAAASLRHRFDPRWGGFGGAPKFPQPDQLDLLLRNHARTGDEAMLAIVTTTLDAMASGGIYDQLGGGFHRYSVDAHWLVPHFEKMLYDQALVARSYLHAWKVTGEPRYLQVLSETIDYVRRDLRHPTGGFYSSEDADSEGEEGKFYVWQLAELEAELGPAAAAAAEWWGVTRSGNFAGEPGAEDAAVGSNILHRPVRGDLVRPPGIEDARQILLAARDLRVRPGLDDKVLTEWNGLFLATLAEAAAATGRDDWLDDARTNAEFLRRELRGRDGRWQRSWQDGQARHLAYAADYAALVDGFTRLAEATGEAGWILEARSVADAMLDLFWDDGGEGLFTTGRDAAQLIARPKDILDNVVPSANGAASVALLRLGALVGDDTYRQRAEAILRLVASPLTQHPAAFCHLLGAVELTSAPVIEVAVVGDRPDLVQAVQTRYLPNAVLAWGEPYPSPLFEARSDGYAYVCRDYACLAPVDNTDELISQLQA